MARIVKIASFSDGEIPHFFNIDEPVGPKRPNRHDDVSLIQYLLRSLANIPLSPPGIPSGMGLYPIYFEHDHFGVFGDETKNRLANFIKRLETAKTNYFPNDEDSLLPIQKADVEKMKFSGNVLLQLNRFVFRDNPLAFVPNAVRRRVHHLNEGEPTVRPIHRRH